MWPRRFVCYLTLYFLVKPFCDIFWFLSQHNRDPAQVLLRWSLQKGYVSSSFWNLLWLLKCWPSNHPGIIVLFRFPNPQPQNVSTPMPTSTIFLLIRMTWSNWMVWIKAKKAPSAGILLIFRNKFWVCTNLIQMMFISCVVICPLTVWCLISCILFRGFYQRRQKTLIRGAGLSRFLSRARQSWQSNRKRW